MRYVVFGFAVIVIIGLLGLVALPWRVEIEPLTPAASADAPDPDQIAAGERLALLGNCAGCHTTPGGEALAGGLAINTPFGKIHSTNITPDADTGIGDWPLEAYVRAMREGVDREGRHLYPAFPYEYFTRISDADLADLYAWNMAQPAVDAQTPPNDLAFPTNWRPLLAGWKLLFHSDERFEASSQRSQAWNYGAYIAEGLGHCGACHTPRNRFGGAMTSRADEGGEAYDWWAPPLTSANPAPRIWTEDALQSYLRTGRSHWHGVAAGPMAAVVHDSLALVPETDTAALALYLGDRMARPPAPQDPQDRGYGVPRTALATDRPAMGTDVFEDGARLFAANCASCHHGSGPTGGQAFPRLSFATAVAGPDPRNLVQVVLWGIGPHAGSAEGYMPRFATELTDAQVAAIAGYLRGAEVGSDLVERLRAGGPVPNTAGGPLSGFASTEAGTRATDAGATP